jgi:hypothetical protein
MRLTEAAYLAALPVAGTLAAYLFEFGFAGYHGIPASLIQLSASQLVGAASLGILFLWVIHLYLSLGIAFLARRKLLVFKFIGLGMLFAALPFLFLLGMGNETRLWELFIICFLFPSVSGLLGVLLSKDRSQPFSQRWWERSSFWLEESEKPRDKLHSLIDVPQQWFAASLLSMFLVFALGIRYASLATPTMVTKSDPAKALIVIYGERWFFRPLQEVNQPRRVSKGELYVLSGDSAKEVTLIPAPKLNVTTEK